MDLNKYFLSSSRFSCWIFCHSNKESNQYTFLSTLVHVNENQHLTKFCRVLSALSTEPGNGMNPQANLVWPLSAQTFDDLLSLWETKFCGQGHMQPVVKSGFVHLFSAAPTLKVREMISVCVCASVL